MRMEITDNLNILLAEDDKGHATLLRKNLWRTCVDAHIIHFSDGRQLLNFLGGKGAVSEIFKTGKYILLLDIKMPGINGIDVLKKMKADPTLNQIPVVMVTTTGNPREIEYCYEQGCAFYIVKPSDYIKFMETIQYLGAFLSLPCLMIPVIESSSSNIN